MNYSVRPVLVTKDHAFQAQLKEFLYKMGFREFSVLEEGRDVAQFLLNDVWPLVFIEHTDGVSDAYLVFERLFTHPSFELVPYVFLVPSDSRKYALHWQSVGARGVLRKPIRPTEAEALVKEVMPREGDPDVELCFNASRALLRGDLNTAMAHMESLRTHGVFGNFAELGYVRCLEAHGQISKAHEGLLRLKERAPRSIRVMCELADFYKRNAQYTDAIKLYKDILAMNPELTLKIWDHAALLIELDALDEACLLLESLYKNPTFKETSIEGIAKIAYSMGLANHIPHLLKTFPSLSKLYCETLPAVGKPNENGNAASPQQARA